MDQDSELIGLKCWQLHQCKHLLGTFDDLLANTRSGYVSMQYVTKHLLVACNDLLAITPSRVCPHVVDQASTSCYSLQNDVRKSQHHSGHRETLDLLERNRLAEQYWT